MPPARNDRQPWPMKWIAIAVLLVIVPYTFVRLHYAKPNKAFEPYEDMQSRANTLRLLQAGYQRITLNAQRPADGLRHDTVTTTAAAGGIPKGLDVTVVQPPLLPADILSVAAPASIAATEEYPIQFECTIPDNKQQLGGAEMYLRSTEIVITPDFERLVNGLQTRGRDNVILLTIPASTLKPGNYRLTLVGEHSSRAWTLQVH